jgi:protein-S-isoprenylcysteine O-methyltransferase Ste14
MEVDKKESKTSLLLRNLVFTVLQPGLVAGVIPYYIVEGNIESLYFPWRINTWLGIAVFLAGFAIMLRCIIQFALEGKGTLSPVDPTKRLVVKGLYKFSRNPMYVGVILMLIGEALATQSSSLWVYLTIVFVAFNLFIILHEEPRLRRDFGQEYSLYKRKVRRWL